MGHILVIIFINEISSSYELHIDREILQSHCAYRKLCLKYFIYKIMHFELAKIFPITARVLKYNLELKRENLQVCTKYFPKGYIFVHNKQCIG